MVVEGNITVPIFMIMVLILGLLSIGVKWFLSQPVEEEFGNKIEPMTGEMIPHQRHFLQCSHKRCEVKYKILLTFGCPSYRFDINDTVINYEIWNIEKTQDYNGSIKASEFITDPDSKSQAYVSIGSNVELHPSFLSTINVWLSDSEGNKTSEGRIFLFSISVAKEKSRRVPDKKGFPSKEEQMTVYQIRKWITKLPLNIILGNSDNDTVNASKDVKFVPKFPLPRMNYIETGITLLSSVTLSCFLSFWVVYGPVESGHFRRSGPLGLYLIAFLYAIVIGLLFTSGFTSWFKLSVKYNEVTNKFIRDKQAGRSGIFILILLGILCLIMTAVVSYFGYSMRSMCSYFWVGICAVANLLHLGIWFIVYKFDLWKRICNLKHPDKKAMERSGAGLPCNDSSIDTIPINEVSMSISSQFRSFEGLP